MARAVELAALVEEEVVDSALGLAAVAGRFDFGDLESIVDHLARQPEAEQQVLPDMSQSLSQGTRSWEGLGQ